MLRKAIEKIYRDAVFSRHDPDGTIFYFSASDFPGLNARPFSFDNGFGDTLKGYFYSYGAPSSEKIVIFDHGMGVGHRAYLREINMLCEHGFTVFSYDHTGCSESGGETTRGFSGSVSDLDRAVSAVKSLDEYKNAELYVMGHSWGAFSAMNIAALHPEIKKVVAMSGFISVDAIQRQFIPAILASHRRSLYALEESTGGKYAALSSVESLGGMNGEALIIHSKDDKTVSAKRHFEKIRAALSGKENIKFLLVNGKDHNPNYTVEAVKYKDAFFADRKARTKKGLLSTEQQKNDFVSSYDWHKMTEQDTELWEKIFEFFDGK